MENQPDRVQCLSASGDPSVIARDVPDGSCRLNWPNLEPQESRMARLLGLEPDERVITLITLGYPDPKRLLTWSQKKPLAELRSLNVTR